MHNIRYSHLKFVVNIMQDAVLPNEKVSMLAGAMLSRFKALYCISDRNCIACSNRSSCIIQRMIGSGFNIEEPIAKQSDLQPRFIIKCLDRRRNFKEGDILEFEVVLFDQLIELYSQYMYVFDTVGHIGIGPKRVKYELLYITDINGNVVFKDGNLLGDICTLDMSSYIASRKDGVQYRKLSFISPFFPYIDSEQYCFIDDDVLASCLESRLDSMEILEAKDKDALEELRHGKDAISEIYTKVSKRKYYLRKEDAYIDIPIYSGSISFNDSLEPYIEYFLVGEKFCIGQNLMMGFGQYVMEG